MSRPAPRLELPLGPRRAGTALHDWLYREIRDAIVTRRLAAGARLPASRDLARQHHVSRSTIVSVFEQLTAEGYLVGRAGSGTFVTTDLPDGFFLAGRARRAAMPASASQSRPRSTPPTPPDETPPAVFTPCAPPADVFPLAEWSRLLSRRLRRDGAAMLQRCDPRGHPRLRREISDYLGAARSVRCDPSRIVIVTGTQQALDFTARLLLRPGGPVWMENPGYEGAVAAFRQAGARLVPVDVDDEGFDVEAALRQEPRPGLAYVTPANQFPLAHTLSLARRARLLEVAAARDFYLFEDDYDGEFRYDVRPLGSLQGQDLAERVIYCGSFNKVLHTGLRLAYVVLPPALVEPFLALREAADRYLPTLEQVALADFFAAGLFTRHLRRAREACLVRRDTLLASLQKHLGGWIEPQPCVAGFHVIARLRNEIDDLALTEQAARHRVRLWPLSPHYLARPRRDRVVLGFAAHRPATLQAAVRRLAEATATLP